MVSQDLVSSKHCWSEPNSIGNPKDCGASISSQGLILMPETSRQTPYLFGLGRGMNSATAL
jgi:hypothetical protein